MTPASTLDPDAGPGSGAIRPPGHDTGSLGPGDRSDTGSDSVGPTGLDPAILADDGDASGTGVDPSPVGHDAEEGADIGFDRIVGADEAGLGGGLDQAEEGRLGITDAASDPLDPLDAARAPPDTAGPDAAADDTGVRSAPDDPDAR